LEKPYTIEQRDKEQLRAGYSPAIRRFEIASIAAYGVSIVWLGVKLAPRAAELPFLALTLLLIGFVMADFLTGMFHWAADTWGTVDWPIVGVGLIRPFREHHVDQLEITRHDFIETNGASCFIVFFFASGAALLPQGPTHLFSFVVGGLVFSFTLLGFLTNQFHKWAHYEQVPPAVALLQRWHLILPRDHHQIHHTAPYTKYYCITTGWLNEPLYRIGYYRFLERIISAVTGLVPREDDLGKAAAAQLIDASGPSERESAPLSLVKPAPLPPRQ
jgi:ubiquitin-conjugating enzyme E2 variant